MAVLLGLLLTSPGADPVAADPVRGEWGELIDWPIVPIHIALTPGGDLMSFGTDEGAEQRGDLVYSIWDPATGEHLVKPNTTSTDIFCAIQVIEPGSDRVLTAGGDVGGPGNLANPEVTLYSDATGSLTSGPSMSEPRWYATGNVLPSGDIIVQGGSGEGSSGPGVITPEIRRADGSWDRLTGASSSAIWGDQRERRWWYPRSWVAPDGRLFGIAGSQMYYLDPTGAGSIELAGTFPGDNIMATSTAVMFRPGQILQVGGGAPHNGAGAPSSAAATVVDLNSGIPVVTSVAPMAQPRHWANSTVLADGTVLVTGGAAGNNTLDGVAYAPELWDPETDTWTTVAVEETHRLYHSTAILLPDGRVLSGGGGVPGPTDNLNAQIFSPPYLFEADGSPAQRPVITSAPDTVTVGGSFPVEVTASVTDFALLRAGAVTHSFNNGQRYIPLASIGTGTARTVIAPADGAVAPPGTYLLFALDGDGTPSVASLIEIDPDVDGVGAPTVATFGFEDGADAAPGGWIELGVGDEIGLWTVASPVSKDHAAHHGGNGGVGHHVDLDDDGSVVTTVSGLEPGRLYVLSFRSARHSAVARASGAVSVGDSTTSWTPTASSKAPWATVSIPFRADSSSTTVTFSGAGSSVPWGGVLIDDATIVAVEGADEPPPDPGASIEGRVVDTSDRPQSGIQVDLFTSNPVGERLAYLTSTSTAGDGSYRFEAEVGCYVATFIAGAGRSFTNGSQWSTVGRCLDPGERGEGVDAVLQVQGSTGTIQAVVVDATGLPVAGVVVDLFTAAADGGRGSFVADAITGADGAATFETEPGCSVLTFIAGSDRLFVNGSQWSNVGLCVVAGGSVSAGAELR